MIQAVFLDAGGILFNNVTEESIFMDKLASYFHVEATSLQAEFESRDADYETDSRHVHDVLAESLIAAGASPLYFDWAWIDAAYIDALTAHTVVFDALRKLRARRLRPKIVLANNEARHWEYIKNITYSHLGLFDVIGSSWRVGAVKPEQEYFESLCGACDCSPTNALLIDDNLAVIRAAEKFGLQTFYARKVADASRILLSVETYNETY